MRFAWTLVWTSAALVTGESLAQPAFPANAAMLIVHRDSTVHCLVDGRLEKSSTVGRGSAVAGVRRALLQTESGSGEFWDIVPVHRGSPAGWVRKEDLKQFEDFVSDTLAGPMPFTKGLPELINLQRDDLLRSAWQEVQAAVEENERLPEGDRLPEPYYARAEIWRTVNNYGNAVQDYLAAITHARKAGGDLANCAAYLARLDAAIEEFEKIPTTPTLGNNADFSFAARDHFVRGYHAFWRRDYTAALHSFDNAVQCNPRESAYWYYRALTFKQMGNESRAQADALLGAKVEKLSRVHRPLGALFTRVQGDSRLWIETFRVGDPSHRILRLAAEGVFIMSSQP